MRGQVLTQSGQVFLVAQTTPLADSVSGFLGFDRLVAVNQGDAPVLLDGLRVIHPGQAKTEAQTRQLGLVVSPRSHLELVDALDGIPEGLITPRPFVRGHPETLTFHADFQHQDALSISIAAFDPTDASDPRLDP